MKMILVIDDEPSVRSILKKMLEREGFDVITAPDGNEGIKLFSTTRIDLVITDIIMPEKEGIETIRELQKEYPHIPVIAISGGGRNSPENYLTIAKLLGASAVLEKPVGKETLLASIQKALNQQSVP